MQNGRGQKHKQEEGAGNVAPSEDHARDSRRISNLSLWGGYAKIIEESLDELLVYNIYLTAMQLDKRKTIRCRGELLKNFPFPELDKLRKFCIQFHSSDLYLQCSALARESIDKYLRREFDNHDRQLIKSIFNQYAYLYDLT